MHVGADAPRGGGRELAALGALYFLGAAVQTLPVVAYQGLLIVELRMPPSVQTIYYAVTFLPWLLKPAYALLSDACPVLGYRRRSYFVAASAASALAYLATALIVTTMAELFLAALVRCTPEPPPHPRRAMIT